MKKVAIIMIITLIILLLFPLFPSFKTITEWFTTHKPYHTFIVSILAISLGAFYYFHRSKHDSDIKLFEARCQQQKILLERLDAYDHSVEALLNKKPSNENELLQLRQKITKQFEYVRLILKKYNENILKFKPDEIEIILGLDSFVHNSSLMKVSYNEYLKKSLNGIRDTYIKKVKSSLGICFKI